MKTFSLALVTGAVALALLAPATAGAALEARPGGMVYDSATDLTWLLDWNAAAGSAFDDGTSPLDGRMSWASAAAWAEALVWGGVDDWRLPTTAPCFGFGCRAGEIGGLWYDTLGNVAGQSMAARGPFQNLASAPYWTGSTSGGTPSQAWYFNTLGGSQNLFPLSAQAHAVAVRQGDVLSPVPAPPAAWMVLAGLAVVAGVSRRRRGRGRP